MSDDMVTVERREWENLNALAAVANAMLEAARPLVLTKLKAEQAEDAKALAQEH